MAMAAMTATTPDDDNNQNDEQQHSSSKGTAMEPFLTISDTPIYFQEDWDTGIGGGLWSTGLAMAHYLTTEHAREQVEQLYRYSNNNANKRLSILELGSGNGFLATCWMALAGSRIEHLVVSDDAKHLPLMQRTMDANQHLMNLYPEVNIHILEHMWGEFTDCSATTDTTAVPKNNNNSPEESNADHNIDNDNDYDMAAAIRNGTHQFDVIVGSDVAYHETLYDPLIASLERFSAPIFNGAAKSKTICLIGVTMNDTRPEFFRRLREHRFSYRRLSDHLYRPEYRGDIFGIFILQKMAPLKKKT